MRKILKKFLAGWLAVAACLSMTAIVNVRYADALTTTPENYYSDITASGGRELLGQLHDLITTTHNKYPSYKECKNYLADTDCGSAENTVIEFYTHEDIAVSNFDESGGWNREHVWPKTLSHGLWDTSGGGADLHHIRPSEKDLNAERDNLRYGEVNGGTPVYQSGVENVIGGYKNSTTFEPLDNVKGDVARIVFYMYTHYNTAKNVGGTTNGESHRNVSFGTLKFSSNGEKNQGVITASDEQAAVKLLLEWNKLDPVDEIEKTRNEAAYEIQGNRNPFIDNSDYAEAIFGDGSVTVKPETPVVTPVGSATITIESFKASDPYGFYDWSAGGIKGTGYIFGTERDCMQFSHDKPSYYIASTTATPRAIKSITVKSYYSADDKDWKLLTSNTPYGEVNGKPTNGTDRGVKTVTPEGVTWTVDGNDTYFALVLESAKSAYLDTIIVEYGDEAEESEKNTAEFKTAVNAIPSDGSLSSRFETIKSAIDKYNALSVEDKNTVTEEKKKLDAAIAAYNDTVNFYNSSAQSAEIGAVSGLIR